MLIFDDCLSAIDTATEEKILNNLKRLMKGKTAIIISHRISSIRDADEILVLDSGKIVEQGDHVELLKNKGPYFELYNLQRLQEQEL